MSGWRKPSSSNPHGNCAWVGVPRRVTLPSGKVITAAWGTMVAITNPDLAPGVIIPFTRVEWEAFTAAVKAGEFDLDADGLLPSAPRAENDPPLPFPPSSRAAARPPGRIPRRIIPVAVPVPCEGEDGPQPCIHRDGATALTSRTGQLTGRTWQVCAGCNRSPARALADLARRWPPATTGVPDDPAAQADKLRAEVAAYTGKDGL